MTEEGRAYNVQEFAASESPPANPGDTMPARIGALAPDFEAPALDGVGVRLSDFRDKRHVVIMTGAVTSPMCAFEIPALNQLHEEFKSQGVSFFLLYTRESHPAERYPSHSSREQKLAHARDLKRLEDVRFPILIDSLDGKIHRSYGTWPNALFVVHKDARLVYRSNMANHRELRQFLEDLVAADRLATEGRMLHTQYSERLVGHEADQATHRRVYERAGPKAFEDYWRKRPQFRGRWP
jgi:alkyl hydroperoxide reductase subunit AhpC